MSYRIGSFNMKNFGNHPKRDFEVIARIIREEQLDVVALQEIKSEGKGVKQFLEECVKYELYDWEFCSAVPKNSLGEEGYAYIWNRNRFQITEFSKQGEKRAFSPVIIDGHTLRSEWDKCDFSRAPYFIRLTPTDGGFCEFRLINIHVYFGSNRDEDIIKRQIEYGALTQVVYPAISQRRYGGNRPAYTIAMGDYNLNIVRPYIPIQSKKAILSEEYRHMESNKMFRVLTIQDQLTTLKSDTRIDEDSKTEVKGGYANNYDHFSYSPELSHFSDIKCWAVDAVNKYCNGDFARYNSMVSDHLPIVMEINI